MWTPFFWFSTFILNNGFFKKLLFQEWTSDQLNISWPFFSSKLESLEIKTLERHSLNVKKCLSNVLITGESNSTDQRFILKKITSEKIHTLTKKILEGNRFIKENIFSPKLCFRNNNKSLETSLKSYPIVIPKLPIVSSHFCIL